MGTLLLENISREDMKRLFQYPQPVAAKIMGVSVSTLKRRFYALNMGKRWPYYKISSPKKSSPKRTKLAACKKIGDILNKRDLPETYLDQSTLHVLNSAFLHNLHK